jgi:putative hemolysin
MIVILSLILIVIFFLLSAFFSGIETGLVSLDKIKLEQESKTNKRKNTIYQFLKTPDNIFGTTLIGNNISVVVLTSVTVFLIKHLNKQYEMNISNTTMTLALSILILIFAEMIPKAIYRDKSYLLVSKMFPLLKFFYLLFRPFVKIVSLINSFFVHILKLKERGSYFSITRDDLSYMLSEAEDTGVIHEDQREMLEEALEFTELKAENVMVHRTDIIALHKDMKTPEILEIAQRECFTRYPVYDDDLDNIVGMLIIYDLMKVADNREMRAKDFVRETFFAPETMNVNTLLTEMQTNKKSMAIIVDAFGGTAGLVTVEDILEEIVGEIEDEFDISSKNVEVIGENEYIVQGFVEIDFLNDQYDLNLPEGDYETIAGLVLDRLRRIPTLNTKLKVGRWNLQIIQVSTNKIEKIKLSLAEEK